jgi:aminopeptidase
MADFRIEKLAQLLVTYSLSIKPGDRVVIQGQAVAGPLLKAIYARVLEAGGHPLMQVSLPGAEEIFYRYASEAQLDYVPPPVELVMATYDARISIISESNTRSLSRVDPAKIVRHSRARAGLMRTFMRRSASGELRWVVAPFPTDAYAQDADMGLAEYEDFVYRACLSDEPDPVAYWRRFAARQQKITNWLKDKKQVHITAPETDLHMSIEGRSFVSSAGNYNMPDGEIFTGPVENSAEGQVYFSYPAVYEGREVTGIRLYFEEGKVIRATAEKNEAILHHALAADAGASYLGEFAIGTNEMIAQFTREILFDEKIGGSFHLAVGAGYPETGSRNESAIHWDMICDLRRSGAIWVDDILLYRDGRFMFDF